MKKFPCQVKYLIKSKQRSNLIFRMKMISRFTTFASCCDVFNFSPLRVEASVWGQVVLNSVCVWKILTKNLSFEKWVILYKTPQTFRSKFQYTFTTSTASHSRALVLATVNSLRLLHSVCFNSKIEFCFDIWWKVFGVVERKDSNVFRAVRKLSLSTEPKWMFEFSKQLISWTHWLQQLMTDYV